MDSEVLYFPPYDRTDRDHMRRLLEKASPLFYLIAANLVAFGTQTSVELIDRLADAIGYENENQKDDDELQELKNDRYSLINLYGAVIKEPTFLPLYAEIGNLLRKYGLFDEEVILLEKAVSGCYFSREKLADIKHRLRVARCYRDSDDANMTEAERNTEKLRRALRKKPLDVSQIDDLVKQCTDDDVLYDIVCGTDKDEDMVYIRERAARRIRNRDYQYAISSQILNPARTSMILNLFDSLEGDELFIARTILTDPDYRNKGRMLLYCKSEELLMLGWRDVFGERRFCAEWLHKRGSRFPEAYENLNAAERSEYEQIWLSYAAEKALDILVEDDAVRKRLPGTISVDSEPLHFFLSIHHPSPGVRCRHADMLKHPGRIAYVGSWTSDDEIKKMLSVKIDSKELVTEMIFGDLSAVDLIFGFPRPNDMTLQDRFCFEIMKNHPDREIREHVREELLRAEVEIPDI